MIARTFGSPRATRFFFNRAMPIYRWLVNNALWRDSLREVARHFPPSGADLRLLDVGCGHGNSVLGLLACRPDLHVIGLDFAVQMLRHARRTGPDHAWWAQANITRLPLSANSVDAITGHSVFYMLEDHAAFLGEAMRVLRPGGRLILLDPVSRPFPLEQLAKALRPRHTRTSLSLFLWHIYSRMHNRFNLSQMVEILQKAGFERVLTERAVNGYGVLSRGEKPYTHLTTLERIAQTAAADQADTDLVPLGANDLQSAQRGQFVFLLIRQTRSSAPWRANHHEAVRWDAMMVSDRISGEPYLLAFTSLPKAVEFMQPAVMRGTLDGVNKIAKFEKTRASDWTARLLLNPPFEALFIAPRYEFRGVTMVVDPVGAVVGEE